MRKEREKEDSEGSRNIIREVRKLETPSLQAESEERVAETEKERKDRE